jgi:hypothetical protein
MEFLHPALASVARDLVDAVEGRAAVVVAPQVLDQESPPRWRVSAVVPPLCGVTMVCGAAQNGLSGSSGASLCASNPAPAI